MKKIFSILSCLAFLCYLKSQSNTHFSYISEMFELIHSKPINANLDPKARNNISASCDSNIYIISRKGFENQDFAGYAKIIKINLFANTENYIHVQPPPEFLNNGGKLSNIWIWALAASDSFLFLAVDEEIWVYQFTIAKYEYLNTIALKYVSELEIVNNILHAFVENGNGFDWFKINLSNFEIQNVRTLELRNRFFLQIDPVKIIAIQNDALYFLQQNEPAVEKYALSGELLANYRLKIPNWRSIPDEITSKLDSMDNISERSYALTKFSILDYNLMHLFYVFPNERFLMIAIDQNKNTETFITPFFIQIIGDSSIVESYSKKLDENQKFGEKYFPFLIARDEGNVVFKKLDEYIAQINLSTSVLWQNKTQKEYENEVNLYHRDHEPIEKIEIFHFSKNYIPIDSIQFLDYDNQTFLINDIKKDKAIFIISKHPQCSGCIKTLWNYFTLNKMPEVELYNVSPNCDTYLLKKESIKEVDEFLKTKYIPLFFYTKQLNPATERLLNQKANPIVIIFNKKKKHIEVISTTHIMGEMFGSINPSFIHTIRNFVEN